LNHQRAADLADLAMDSAYPPIIETDVGIGTSTDDGG
jgi:hypothetical protein